ncbi:unnamed protein product [marine sediment metagenome]|uniref:Uncharacterized protein n=1 Tax=marine sediment metagenome TaxID=412755 RepID=X0XL72_9ZZZZ
MKTKIINKFKIKEIYNLLEEGEKSMDKKEFTEMAERFEETWKIGESLSFGLQAKAQRLATLTYLERRKTRYVLEEILEVLKEKK